MRFLIALALAALLPHYAYAGWLFTKSEKPFGGSTTIAMATGTGAAIMIACDDGELKLSVPSAEDWSDSLTMAALAEPKILLAIDGAEPMSLEANIAQNGVGKVLAQSDVEEAELRDVIAKIIAGKKNLDFAVELNGEKFYPSRTSVVGSGKHLKKVLAACPSAEAPEPEKK